MSRFMPQFLRITDPGDNFIALFPLDGTVSQSVSISHQTRSPGGFWQMVFELAVTDVEFEVWANRLLYKVRIEAGALNVVWEGRIEIVEIISRPGVIRLTCNGDWSKFTDVVSNDRTGYSHVYSVKSADTIIQEMIDNAFHADTPAPTIDTSNFEASGFGLTKAYPEEWNLWEILTDSSEGVLSFPNTSGEKMDFLIYEDGIRYVARNPVVPDWRTYMGFGNTVPTFPLSYNWGPVSNAVSVLHDVSGTETETTIMQVDQASIDKYHRRERTIANIGESPASNATKRMAGEITEHGDVQPQMGGFEITRVWDNDGVEQPLCGVRAGETIYVSDWIANGAGLGSVNLDATRWFVVNETNCDHDSGVLTITPDRDPNGLQEIFQKNRIRSK